MWYYAWSDEEYRLVIAQLCSFSEQLNLSHNPCVTYYVVIIIPKSTYQSVRENSLYRAKIFHVFYLLTSSASFPCSVSVVIIVYLGSAEVGA